MRRRLGSGSVMDVQGEALSDIVPIVVVREPISAERLFAVLFELHPDSAEQVALLGL